MNIRLCEHVDCGSGARKRASGSDFTRIHISALSIPMLMLIFIYTYFSHAWWKIHLFMVLVWFCQNLFSLTMHGVCVCVGGSGNHGGDDVAAAATMAAAAVVLPE